MQTALGQHDDRVEAFLRAHLMHIGVERHGKFACQILSFAPIDVADRREFAAVYLTVAQEIRVTFRYAPASYQHKTQH
jgi:uncharacterized protein (DUF1684 family)